MISDAIDAMDDPTIERELKYMLDADAFDDILAWGRAQGQELRAVTQVNVYFDTPTRGLNAEGIMLRVRRKYGLYTLTLKIREATDMVDDREVGNVVKQAVDRKIAAHGVFFGSAEFLGLDHCRQRIGLFPGIDIGRLGRPPKRRYLDDLARKRDQHQAKPPPDDPGVAEKLPNLLRACVGADVEVLG